MLGCMVVLSYWHKYVHLVLVTLSLPKICRKLENESSLTIHCDWIIMTKSMLKCGKSMQANEHSANF